MDVRVCLSETAGVGGIAGTFASSLTAGTVTLSNDGTTKPLTSDSLRIALYTVNQKTPVDQWQLLGTHTFAGGSGGYVKLSGDTADGYGARADAVKFVKK
ncbi:MAG: hypothetical protein J7639_33950 [Paenibacillaceae bacterium]|nr:hypothetical protein [Paenibacillaceae bacterium]